MFSYLLGVFKPLLHPAGLLWLLLVGAALILLKKKKWLAAACLAGVALLLSVASGRLTVYLLGSLEEPYVRRNVTDLPAADAVVLLGGSHELTKNDPLGFNLNESADRIFMALELMRLKKAGTLVIGGGRARIDGQERTEAGALVGWMESWSMTNFTTLPLAPSRNTHDEAVQTAALAREKGWQKVLLVTSGYHMRRAAATFRTAGVEVTPVACDFIRTGTPHTEPPNPFPISAGPRLLWFWMHEQGGWWIYKWRGWINAEAAAATQ